MKYPTHNIETDNGTLKLIPVQSWAGIALPLTATFLAPLTLSGLVVLIIKGNNQETYLTPIYAALLLMLIMSLFFIIGGGIRDILIAGKAANITFSEDTFFVNGTPYPRRKPISVKIITGRSNNRGSAITYRLYICYNKGKFPWVGKKAVMVGKTKESLLPHAKALAHFLNVDVENDSIAKK